MLSLSKHEPEMQLLAIEALAVEDAAGVDGGRDVGHQGLDVGAGGSGPPVRVMVYARISAAGSVLRRPSWPAMVLPLKPFPAR